MGIKKVQRFFKSAQVVREGDDYGVRLDDRPLRTPEGSPILLPTLPLANAVASEWSNQGDEINPLTMPLMRLACTAVDKVAPVRQRVIEQIARYGQSDLLCYRSTEPDDLVAHQEASWQPTLDWLESTHGIVLKVTQGIVHVQQPATALRKLTEMVAVYDDYPLAGLGELTQLTGSLVLAVACSNGHLTGEQVFLACQLDDDWQADKWGEDHEAAERRKNLEYDIQSAVRFINALM